MSAIPTPPSTPHRLLAIAGSDSGGGAGIQADLKTFAAHGAYGMSVVTAVTAQNTRTVSAVHGIPPQVVAAQIDAVFEDIGVDGVKIGMLGSAEIVTVVAERLHHWLERRPGLPVVLDPVMVAKSGDTLLADDAVEALTRLLLPLATVVTPNLPEAVRLAGGAAAPAPNREEPGLEGPGGAAEEARLDVAREIARLASGPRGIAGRPAPAVLVKGGHGEGETVVDLLWVTAEESHRFEHPRVDTPSTHGTGCTLSSALATRLARGEVLPDAVEGAIGYLAGALRAAYPLGGGHGPVNHLYRMDERRDHE